MRERDGAELPEAVEAAGARRLDGEDVRQLADPGQWSWGPLPSGERERRLAVLADIERRIEQDGSRVARPDSSRGRQFMPFAALEDMEDWLDNAQRRTDAGKASLGSTRPMG